MCIRDTFHPEPATTIFPKSRKLRTSFRRSSVQSGTYPLRNTLHHVNVDTLWKAFYAFKRKAAAGVDGVTWQDYEADLGRNLEDLHGRVHRGAYPAATISPDVHTEGGWSAKAAGDRSSGRQDRLGRMRHGAQRHLRRGFPRVLIRVPTWTRAT